MHYVQFIFFTSHVSWNFLTPSPPQKVPGKVTIISLDLFSLELFSQDHSKLYIHQLRQNAKINQKLFWVTLRGTSCSYVRITATVLSLPSNYSNEPWAKWTCHTILYRYNAVPLSPNFLRWLKFELNGKKFLNILRRVKQNQFLDNRFALQSAQCLCFPNILTKKSTLSKSMQKADRLFKFTISLNT